MPAAEKDRVCWEILGEEELIVGLNNIEVRRERTLDEGRKRINKLILLGFV